MSGFECPVTRQPCGDPAMCGRREDCLLGPPQKLFVTKDSGERQEFDTGARRDTQEGKSRPDLISPIATRRLGELLARGADKYGERNWEKGMPTSRFLASACRHLNDYMAGDREEDHLAAVLFNVGAILHFEECKPELDDARTHLDERSISPAE